MSYTEDEFYDSLKAELRRLDNSIRLRREVPLKHKDKRFRLDFLLDKNHRALCIEHNGKYHYGRMQSDKDDKRSKRVVAALHYHFIEGSRIEHVFISIEDSFFAEEFPKLVKWLQYGDSKGFDWSLDFK